MISTLIRAITCARLFIACEEPTLRETFGTPYDDYCGSVRRWWLALR